MYTDPVKDFLTKLGIAFIAGMILSVLAVEYWLWRMETHVTAKATTFDNALNDAIDEAMKSAETDY